MVLEITANLNGGDLVTPDNELTYKIYGSADNYASAIATLGSAVNDAKVSVLNGVVTIINVDVGNETSFKISSIDLNGNESVLSDTSDTPFIIEVDTTNSGVSNTDQFQFTGAEGDYDVVAKQNGVVIETFNNLSDEATITFASAGIYDLEIKSKKVNGFNRIAFNGGGDNLKITDIKQWGDVAWSSFSSAFFGCSNMLTTATDVPNLSSVTDMSSMFYFASSANPDTSNWDVSSVTNMKAMFENASSANPDTSNWDVSSVTNMRRMFRDASSANPDTSNWDVSSVTDMSFMFENASSANPDTSNWDVSSVTDMSSMFENSNLSEENLTACYENWSQLTLQNNVLFSAGTTKYNASGQAGRDILVNTYNWTITDGGQVTILNQFSGASLGLSLELLDKDYSGFCIKVRRSSDNAELDIGFVNNELDTASLLTFVGSGNGFVSIWYDQSGEGNNLLQTLASKQPQIAINGVVILENGKPAMEFDGVDDFFFTDNYAVELSANDAQVFAVNTPVYGIYLLTEGDSVSPYSSNFILGDSNATSALWVNATEFGSEQVNAQQVFGFEKTGGSGTGSKTFQTFNNGATDGVSGIATVNEEVFGRTAIGSSAEGLNSFYKGKLQSIIVYKNLDNDYVSVMNTIKSFYQIT